MIGLSGNLRKSSLEQGRYRREQQDFFPVSDLLAKCIWHLVGAPCTSSFYIYLYIYIFIFIFIFIYVFIYLKEPWEIRLAILVENQQL